MVIINWKLINLYLVLSQLRLKTKSLKLINHLLKDQDVSKKFDSVLNWKIRPIGWTFAEWMENLQKFKNIIQFGMKWWYIIIRIFQFLDIFSLCCTLTWFLIIVKDLMRSFNKELNNKRLLTTRPHLNLVIWLSSHDSPVSWSTWPVCVWS